MNGKTVPGIRFSIDEIGSGKLTNDLGDQPECPIYQYKAYFIDFLVLFLLAKKVALYGSYGC